MEINNYSVCITTFSKRFSYVEKLVTQVRSLTTCDILIAVNGDYNQEFNNEFRKQILNLCLNFDNVFPIFFPEQRGLAKLWNTLVIHSKQDWCLLLNDDVELDNDEVFTSTIPSLGDKPDLRRINGSFSHFLIHKDCLDTIGYFDERLLGFGEEDGDIFYRYIETYNEWIQELWVHGFTNLVVDVRDENIKAGIGKYSQFNRNFCFSDEPCKYIPTSEGITGLFGQHMKKNIDDLSQYPYEKFFKENKSKL
jgi:glycosyltransferase involved in cell wall biosynthesis